MPEVQPTNNPVPSDHPADARDNFKRIDEVVNLQSEQSGPTRTGKRLETLYGLERKYLQAIQDAGGAPLNGGVWASGQTFTAYNQFMVYNGVAYKPLVSTSLPYGPTGAAPDLSFVGPFTEITSVNLGGYTNYTSKTVADMIAGLTTDSSVVNPVVGHVWHCNERALNSGGGASWVVVLTSSITVDNVDFIESTLNSNFSFSKIIENRNGGVSLIYDDANAVTKNDLLPVSVAKGFKTGLAVFHSGMASSYDVVTLNDALAFKKRVDGEILSHSMNSVALNSSVELTYGESLIRTSATEFSQFGFNPRGFVAPNSVLDAKFQPQLKQSFDFAFIRSVGAGAGLSANNNPYDDRYNLTRIALTDSQGNEVITLQQAMNYVDQARSYEAYICFYAHGLPSYLEDLMDYINDTYRVINPTEWVGNFWGLSGGFNTKSSENLFINSRFNLIRSGDTNPHRWSFVPGTLVTPTINITQNEGGSILDIISSSGAAGASGTLSQNYTFTQLGELTPFCFSIYARSLASTNTKITLSILAKDSSNITIASASEEFTISGNRQRIEVSQGFIPDSNVVSVLCEIRIEAIGSGGVRALIDSPQLERSGINTPYISTGMERYYSVLRRTLGVTVPANANTLVNFNSSLEGTNSIFDLATGVATPSDGRIYLIQCNFGLQSMVAGDIIEIHLLDNGVVSKKCIYSAVTGENILNPSWSIRGDGSTYSIGIRHNSSAGRALTTFSDATMTITSPES